jgi:hypothetical protein
LNISTHIAEELKEKAVANPNVTEDVEKLNHSHITGENVKWQSYCRKQLNDFLNF